MTTTTTARSTKLRDHNFSSFPSFNLKWGCQRQLRCVKNPEVTPSTSGSDFRKRRSSSFDDDYDDHGGIKAVTEKLILDFRAEVDQLQAAFLNGGIHSFAAAAEKAPLPEPRPWNLRSNINGHVPDTKHSVSPARNSDEKSPVKRRYGNDDGEEKGRRKLTVSLSKQEIERDFLAMTGARPPRRPKKRAKSVQKQVDAMFPGFWLTEITADMYKVNEEQPDAGKR